MGAEGDQANRCHRIVVPTLDFYTYLTLEGFHLFRRACRLKLLVHLTFDRLARRIQLSHDLF